MRNILIRNLYKNDYEIINFWLNNPVIKEKKKKFKIKKNKNIKIIISDNIRVGLQLKKKNRIYNFIYPIYYTFGYINKKFAQKSFGKNFEDVGQFYKEVTKSENVENINITKKNFQNLNKKILILGSLSRNKKLIKSLKKNNIKVSISNNYLKKSKSVKKKYDFIVSSGYPFKINDKIVNKYSGKIFNLHATFLPWGKGIGTTLFSFLLKQPTGSSIHLIDKKFDTGDIILRKTFRAKSNDTTRTFYKKLMIITEQIAIDNIIQIFNGNFKRYPQVNFSKKPPYLSRFDFEKIMRILPNGYDTKIKTLIGLGNLLRSNRKFTELL